MEIALIWNWFLWSTVVLKYFTKVIYHLRLSVSLLRSHLFLSSQLFLFILASADLTLDFSIMGSSMLLCIVDFSPLLPWMNFPLYLYHCHNIHSFSVMLVPILHFTYPAKEHIFCHVISFIFCCIHAISVLFLFLRWGIVNLICSNYCFHLCYINIIDKVFL